MGTQSWREFNPTLCELLARIRLQRPDLRLRFIVLSMQTVLTLEMQTDPRFGYRFRRLTVVRFHILGNDSWAFWRRFPLGWPYENDRIGPGGVDGNLIASGATEPGLRISSYCVRDQ